MAEEKKADYTITLPKNATTMDLWRAVFPTIVDASDKPAMKYFIEIVGALNKQKMSVGALLGMTEASFTRMRTLKESELRESNPTLSDEQITEELAHWASGVSWAHEYLYRNNSSLISVQTKVPCPDFLPLHPNQVRGNNAVGEDKMQSAIQKAMEKRLGKPSLTRRMGRWLNKLFG